MEQLDTEQVTKAVVALKQFLKKKKAQNSKQALVEENNTIQLIFTRVTVPVKESLKAIPIKLPHNIRGDGEACLFVKDSDKDRIKAHLKEDPVAGLTKVMPLKKLKKNFSQFKDKRELKAAYGVFLVDDRVLPYVKSLLGKTFFDAKKQPTTVNVTGKKNISEHIRRVLDGTEMFTSPGPCFNVKIAHDGMDTDHIVANIVEGTKSILEHVPKKWKNVKSINIKTSDSVALPIYNALPNSSKLPIESKKRKADDAAAPSNKKAKASEAKTTVDSTKAEAEVAPKKVAVAKKEAASTPAAKAEPTKASPAKKAATPVKAEPTKPNPAKKAASEVKASPSTKKSTPVKASPAKKAATPKKETPVKKDAAKTEKTVTPPAKKSPAKKGSATKK